MGCGDARASGILGKEGKGTCRLPLAAARCGASIRRGPRPWCIGFVGLKRQGLDGRWCLDLFSFGGAGRTG